MFFPSVSIQHLPVVLPKASPTPRLGDSLSLGPGFAQSVLVLMLPTRDNIGLVARLSYSLVK